LFCFGLFSQSNFSFSGDLQINGQTFQEDLSIGAEKREPNINSYLNLILDYKNYLKIGTRLELYRNPIPGFENYEGEGIAYKFVQFQKWNFDITLGNFYDQFGSGVLFRSYFDQNLGIDNSVNGARLKFKPSSGIDLTAIIGKQRNYWDLGEGLIRGFDAQIYVNDYFFKKSRTTINLGGSFVTKKQKDNDPFFILPENIGAWSGRMNISKGRWNFESEYAYKINDPSFTNNYIYKNGNSIIVSGSYSKKGLGLVLSGKRVDNMNFRSDRDASLQQLNINFLTSLNKQQSYSLATIYPYVTQPNGEIGLQFDCFYKIPRKSKLGGKYGTELNFNFSNCFTINKSSPIDSELINEPGTLGYESDFFKIGDEKLFQEININIKKKVNKQLKLQTTYINVFNNDKVLKAQKLIENGTHEKIFTNIFILESEYRLKSRYTIKSEIQHLQTKQHFGNWGMGLIEANLKNIFFSIQDLYNYGNPSSPTHYYSVTTGFIKNSHRIELRYGKVRAGLFCVGGICREVPASNGFSINITSSF
tara:strand:- start:3648 stop:5246 length:1599 start_codon:yes stop_codon:yes gene_type:complete